MVDVVIVTNNARDMVLECLDHLGDGSIASIVVVDNASEDGTAGAVRDHAPEARLVRLDEHHGLSFAFNRGSECGTAPYVLFLNDDMFTEPGAIDRLVAVLDSHPSAASAGGRLADPATLATQDAYRPRAFPTLTGYAMSLTGADRLWPQNPWSTPRSHRDLDDGNGPIEVDQPAGSGLMVRRDVLEQIGGWDEGYWFWFEDVDISRRLSAYGPALWAPEATFRHVGGATVSRWTAAESLRRMLHGMSRYGSLHFPRRQTRALGALLVAMAVPRALVFARLDRQKATLYRDLARNGVALMRRRDVPGMLER
ncbi:MAG TPA: glycosyltransferase [Solirubrobacteraceae bacterium]|nr:glycosyltransferase [Solirubrobacteraceae bacterium]